MLTLLQKMINYKEMENIVFGCTMQNAYLRLGMVHYYSTNLSALTCGTFDVLLVTK